MLIGFDWRNQLAQLGSSIWGALAVENAAHRGAVSNADLMELKGELKKINKHLRKLIDLKKQGNLMAGGFFVV